MYKVKLTVKSVKGHCAAGYKVGDYLYFNHAAIVEAGEPKGICLYALSALMPYLTAYGRLTGEDDWINLKQELQCPDNINAVIFGLEREPA